MLELEYVLIARTQFLCFHLPHFGQPLIGDHTHVVEFQCLTLDAIDYKIRFLLADFAESMFLPVETLLVHIDFVGPAIGTDSSMASLAEMFVEEDAELIVTELAVFNDSSWKGKSVFGE